MRTIEVISTSPVETSARFSQPSPYLRQFGRYCNGLAAASVLSGLARLAFLQRNLPSWWDCPLNGPLPCNARYGWLGVRDFGRDMTMLRRGGPVGRIGRPFGRASQFPSPQTTNSGKVLRGSCVRTLQSR